jgi:hypothetical protein
MLLQNIICYYKLISGLIIELGTHLDFTFFVVKLTANAYIIELNLALILHICFW